MTTSPLPLYPSTPLPRYPSTPLQTEVGDMVEAGDLLGEIVCIEDVDAPRVPIVARVKGLVFARKRHKVSV